MTVAEFAHRTGTTADTVRYYDRIGLLAVDRNAVGHRVFGSADVERMQFIHRAQRFGLHLDQIRELLEVRDRGLCPCGHAHQLLKQRAVQVQAQIGQLQELASDIDRLLAGDPAAPGQGWPCSGGLVQLGTRPVGEGA